MSRSRPSPISATDAAALPIGARVEIEAIAYLGDWRRPSLGPSSTRTTIGGVAGGVVIVILLLIFPLVVTTTTAAIAALLGFTLDKDAATRAEGSELLETNY